VEFGNLERRLGVIYAPKVATGLSPGFQPWERKINEFALKFVTEEGAERSEELFRQFFGK
jgi:hypothetical protein